MNIKLGSQRGLLYGLVLPLIVAFPQQTIAQDDTIDEVVTTGTRSRARSVEDSPAPVDVLSGDYFRDQGGTDLSNLVRNIVPSYNVNTQPISDAATIVRPANLRGLAPDHTLVLINGKRRHRAAVIYWLGNGVSDGAQGPDISLIPAIALKQVEVLRDGAAAQYGSDAIAGVMNFILKDDAEGAVIEARFGEYSEGDGQTYAIAGNIGFPLTDAGFANLSFEYGEADDTDRSIQRDDAAGLIAGGNTEVANPAQIWGSPEITDEWKFFGNFGLDLGNGTSAYMHGNYGRKHVDGGFYFRNPDTRGAVFAETLSNPNWGDFDMDPDTDDTALPGFENEPASVGVRLVGDVSDNGSDCALAVAEVTSVQGQPFTYTGLNPSITDPMDPNYDQLDAVLADPNCFAFNSIFPGGFTPRFGGDVQDLALTAGVRGETDNGLRWDVSVGAGMNDVDFFIRNTVNASLGAATPVEFNPGDYTQVEQMFNLDFGYSPTDNTNLAFGAEWRNEQFEITVGQQESFEIGPLSEQGFSAASNGFPGFSNITGGDWDRKNISFYVDGEWEPTDTLLLAAAVRYEDFDDFGTTTNYKVAANWRVTDNFGVRGTVSTGFKAPTPGQSNAFNVSTEFDLVLNDLVNNGTVPSTSGPALLRGGEELEPEESTNYTVGTFFNVGGLDVTIDYFQIDVDDRLSLTNDFALTQQEVDDLIAEGITSAGNLANFRFFANAFDTETSGFDIVATYPVEWNSIGDTVFSLAYNNTDTEVVAAADNTQINATRIQEYEEGLPETRYNIAANHSYNDWRFLARVSYYDDWFDSEDGNTYDGKSLVDLEAAYSFSDALTITLGAQNAFDETPDENPGAAGGVGNRYSQFSPFGFNGAYYYMRLRYDIL
ncbi:MAG: TonB-dependent receptor plug domain-containing protein [Woeseiaceae bacterium]